MFVVVIQPYHWYFTTYFYFFGNSYANNWFTSVFMVIYFGPIFETELNILILFDGTVALIGRFLRLILQDL